MGHKLIKVEDVFRLVEVTKHGNQIIGTTDLDYQKAWSDRCEKLSLKQCQAIEIGYDLDDLAKLEAEKLHNWDDHDDTDIYLQLISEDAQLIKLGMQKMLEILSDKKFTEGDVMLGWDAGLMSHSICSNNYLGFKRDVELKEHRESYQKNLKPASLQQTEWDVEVTLTRAPIDGLLYIPKVDADGYLIFKKI
jgi:hypothetical protein